MTIALFYQSIPERRPGQLLRPFYLKQIWITECLIVDLTVINLFLWHNLMCKTVRYIHAV